MSLISSIDTLVCVWVCETNYKVIANSYIASGPNEEQS